MTHVFLVFDSTLAYCGCGGWVGRLRDRSRNFAADIAYLGQRWRAEHYLPDVLQVEPEDDDGDS